MQNEKPKYCLNEYTERLAYIIQNANQILDRLEKAIDVENSSFDCVIQNSLDLFLDMIGVEKAEDFCRDFFYDDFYSFCQRIMTLDEFMRRINNKEYHETLYKQREEILKSLK